MISAIDVLSSFSSRAALLKTSRTVVPIESQDPSGVSGNHLRTVLVDGVWHGRRAFGPWRQDQVLAEQHSGEYHTLYHIEDIESSRITKSKPMPSWE